MDELYQYYPGDEYVDWIGVSSFLKKDFLNSLAVEDGSEVCTTRESQIYFTFCLLYTSDAADD